MTKRDRRKTLTLTATNPRVSEARETEIAVHGAVIASARASVLTATDIHAHNSFAELLVHRFAPASVTRLTLTLQ